MNISQNPTLVPGFYSYVAYEATEAEANEKLHANNNVLYNVCYSTMYSFETITPDQYYRLGVNRFLREVRSRCGPLHINTFNIDGALIYFYNRQFVVQLTSIPHPFPAQNIHIPIDRAPNNEIQVDILALLEDQKVANFNLPYLVVIEDPFSRFVWAYPTAKLDSAFVRKAFILAFSRPGVGHDFYIHLRDKVQRIVVDGGSEFKDSFQGNFRQVFPQSTLVVSDPKRKTMGRPTNTGPVEAAIGTLRRVLRDHALGIHHQFLGNRQAGLTQILDAYNNMEQADSLHHSSPDQVVQSLLGKDTPNLVAHLNTYMEQKQEKQLLRKQQVYTQYGIEQENVLFYDRHGGFAYRIYQPPPAFSKLVTIRVSEEAYVITRIHADKYHVDLIGYGNHQNTMENVNIKQLVLVKAPIEMGPQTIIANLHQQVNELRVRHTPREVTQAFQITPEIAHAVGAHQLPALENQRLDNNPIVRDPRAQRVPGHLQGYHLY